MRHRGNAATIHRGDRVPWEGVAPCTLDSFNGTTFRSCLELPTLVPSSAHATPHTILKPTTILKGPTGVVISMASCAVLPPNR